MGVVTGQKKSPGAKNYYAVIRKRMKHAGGSMKAKEFFNFKDPSDIAGLSFILHAPFFMLDF